MLTIALVLREEMPVSNEHGDENTVPEREVACDVQRGLPDPLLRIVRLQRHEQIDIRLGIRHARGA